MDDQDNKLNVIDVTLRDGGYVNDHSFTLNEACSIVNKLQLSNIELIEVGYFKCQSVYNPYQGSKTCHKEYLRRLQGNKKRYFVLMVRPGDTLPNDYSMIVDYGIKMIRFACPPGYNYNLLKDHIKAVHDLKIKVSINCTRASNRKDKEIMELIEFAINNKAEYFYIADTNGAYYPHQVFNLFTKMSNESIKLGYHAHNNLGMALINTIYAIKGGAKIVDSSIAGMGKCAGNLDTILLSFYLNLTFQSNYNLLQQLSILEKDIAKYIRKDYIKDYLHKFTGLLNITSDDSSLEALKLEYPINKNYSQFLKEFIMYFIG